MIPACVQAQETITKSMTIDSVKNDSVYFIGFFVIKETVIINHDGLEVDQAYWSFDQETGELNFQLPDSIINQVQRVTVNYRQTADFLNRVYKLRDVEIIERDTLSAADTLNNVRVARRSERTSDLFGDVDLNRSGSLTRGFTVGNRQDLSLESGLRLDLNGQITDDISINASLTDRSTPIQPDGSTQNLREFDRVFIQLRHENARLELGDVDVSFTDSKFAVVNRRVQGGTGLVNTGFGDYSAAMSVARGEFRVQRFTGIEGLQGPYRLQGNANEEFIIVLAGSERIFVNGRQVQRGVENEYIIDYSLGEITFTNNLLITDETRVVAEYQFLTQNFTRTLFAAEGRDDELAGGKLSLAATYLREADNSNPNTQVSLSESDIELLRELGDDVEDTFVSGADSVGFQENPDFVPYAKVDTLFEGQIFQIFEHIPGDSASVFRVRFTNFDEGNGSYRRVGGTANGLLFEWVGPGNGSYEPVVSLEAPKQHQMISLRSGFAVNKNVEIFGEWSISDFNKNRFSNSGNDDNVDHAFTTGFSVSSYKSQIGTFSGSVRQRFTGRKFEFMDRVRDVEFDRIWNLDEPGREEEEWITEADLTYRPSEKSSITFSGGINKRDLFDGERAEVSLESSEVNAPSVRILSNWVSSDDEFTEQKGDWFKQIGNANYNISIGESRITPFVDWETEKRDQRALNDSLLAGSIEFYDLNPGIRYETGAFSINTGIGYRLNKRAINGKIRKESVSNTQRFSLAYAPSSSFRTQNQVQFRQKNTEEPFLRETQTTESRGVLLRSVNNYLIWDGGVEGELLYEANTERRALFQETFIEVGPELGQFEWRDLNDDGVQQIDEFFPEVNPNEGTFLRQFIPSDDLLPVIDLNVRFRNRINFAEIFNSGDQKFISVLRQIRWNSLFELKETSTERELRKVYLLNPSVLRNQATTINGQRTIRQELIWSDDENIMDIRFSFIGNDIQFQRSAGSEEKKLRSFELESGYRVSDAVRLLSSFKYETDKNESSRFASRGFDITSWSVEPGLRIFINRSTENETLFSYSEKEDRFIPGLAANAKIIRVENRTRVFLFKALQNNIRLQLRNTDVQGTSSSLGEFELTEGAGRGLSVSWNINSTYRFSSFLRGSLQYDGRTVPGSEIIQTMRLVVSAVF